MTFKPGDRVRNGSSRAVYSVIKAERRYGSAGYLLLRVSREPGTTVMYTTWIPAYFLNLDTDHETD